jgi:non-heme chloroperoxidase
MRERAIAFPVEATRRDLLLGAAAGLAALALPFDAFAQASTNENSETKGTNAMPFIKTADNVEIFYKDWGPTSDAQPIVFHHGWPLSADDWDNQMMFFLHMRVSASSPMTAAATAARRRPTPATRWTPMPPTSLALDRSARPEGAPSMSATPPAAARWRVIYVAHAKTGRAAKAVHHRRRAAESWSSPTGTRAACRSRCSTVFAQGARRQPRAILSSTCRPAPSTATTVPGAKVDPRAFIDNWWRQGMMGGAKAHYDCIKAFSETDFTEDLCKAIDIAGAWSCMATTTRSCPMRTPRPLSAKAAAERHPQDLSGPAPRRVHDPSRGRQRRTFSAFIKG